MDLKMLLILFDKVWQAQSVDSDLRLVFKFSAKNAAAWTSLYLDVVLNPSGISFTASGTKPDFKVLADSGIVQILRKQLASCRVVAALKHQSWRDQIWQFKNSEEDSEKLLIFRFAKPPLLELAASEQSLLRASPGSTFTKRKNLELERSEFSPLALEEIFTLESKPLSEPPLEKPALSAGIDRDRRRSLKRRLKTLTASLAKYQEEESLVQEENRLREDLASLRESGYLRSDIGKLLQSSGEQLKKFKVKKTVHIQKRQEILASLAAVQAEIVAIEEGNLSTLASPPAVLATKNRDLAAQARQAWYRYSIDPSAEILVGRSAKDNDALTKQAKGHDYWLHIVQGSGSHVIVPKKGIKNAKQESDLLRCAAILAIHHSPARQDRQGEVYCCERRFLRKTKGLPAGKWLVDRADSLYVRYDDDELRQLLEKRQ